MANNVAFSPFSAIASQCFDFRTCVMWSRFFDFLITLAALFCIISVNCFIWHSKKKRVAIINSADNKVIHQESITHFVKEMVTTANIPQDMMQYLAYLSCNMTWYVQMLIKAET